MSLDHAAWEAVELDQARLLGPITTTDHHNGYPNIGGSQHLTIRPGVRQAQLQTWLEIWSEVGYKQFFFRSSK